MKAQDPKSVTFDAPPVIEVALSIQFDPPNNLNQAHLGAFWWNQKGELPTVRTLPVIDTIKELFSDQSVLIPPIPQFAIMEEPECRLQMESSDSQWICQVQLNRLVVNWRKKSDSPYPRFERVLEYFYIYWKKWTSFVAELGMPIETIKNWEISYVNGLHKGSTWKSPSDWPEILPGLWGNRFAEVDNMTMVGFQGQWIWNSPQMKARVYVEPKPGKAPNDPKADMLFLSLTGRGVVTGPSAEADTNSKIRFSLDQGHDLILSVFEKVTSPSAQEKWGRR